MYNLTIDEFKKAKDGSLFIKKNDKLVAITKDELLKDLKPIKSDISDIKKQQEHLNDMNKFFDLYSKPHFQVVFNSFLIAMLCGLIEVGDQEILKLDELVNEGKITVKEALERHEYLQKKFNELFVNNRSELKGFWEI